MTVIMNEGRSLPLRIMAKRFCVERGPPGDIPDSADVPIVACALAARADLFGTGDEELLDVKSVEGMPIVSPRAMYERLIRGKWRACG